MYLILKLATVSFFRDVNLVHYKSYQYKVSNLICSQKNPIFPCEKGKQINDFNVNTIPPTFLKWVKIFLLLKRNVNYEFQAKLKGSVYCIRIEYVLQRTANFHSLEKNII